MPRLVRINLSALTRMEYFIDVEVPDDVTEAELQDLADQTYDNTDGSEFWEDSDYWEKGSCYAEKLGEEWADLPLAYFVRDENGDLVEEGKANGN